MWAEFLRTNGKRVITVFDPSLVAFNGHHMEFAKMIKEVCEPTFDVKFYVNFRAAMRVVYTLPAQPVADEGIYSSSGRFDDIYQSMTESIVRALNRIDRRDVGPDAILVLHTVTLHQLGGISQWFATLPSSQRPALCMQFQFPLEFRIPNETGVRKRAIDLARAAVGELMSTGRTRLAANSKLLADHISRELEQPCALLPFPVRWPDVNLSIVPDPGIVFGFFGALRTDKGASIIATAIPKFVQRYPDTRFLVHAPRSEFDLSAISALEAIQQVEMIYTNFARKDDYFKQFARASCILLPYDPIEYAYRTSGILIEALGLNRLIITTQNSWLCMEAQQRGGQVVKMESFTPDALVSSLSVARELLLNSAIKCSLNKAVMKENSSSAFCSALIQLASS